MAVDGAGAGARKHPEVEPYQFVEEPEVKEVPLQVSCPRCGGPTRVDMVRTDIWEGDHLTVVEDIPAHVCDRCVEQFYSEPVTDALRRLVQEGLESAKPKREMVVTVYSLAGRIKMPQPPT
jgi:YgiT-type zinc finger domain-containing protein